jgi:3-deoxy-D-manno-octulosonic-acid transferase
MWLLYQITTALTLLVAGPFLLLSRGRHYLETLPGRLGRYAGSVPKSPVWVHAVSVGEVGVAATLVEALPAELPLLVTTITPTGQERARVALGKRAAVAYLPFDLGLPARRFLDRFSPRALVLVEGDLWPLVLRLVKQRGLPVVVVNGRISDRSFGRMSRVRRWLGPLLGRVDRFGVQTEDDRRRLTALGVAEEKVTVTGNLKFESAPPPELPELEATLRELAGSRPILVAGSTMGDEEEQVLDAFERLGGGERALLILAPRHPERIGEVDKLLRERGIPMVRRSLLAPDSQPAVVLLDTMGELASIYRVGNGAFIGGTLVPTGGHNPLEAARFSLPIAVGPSMENFQEMAGKFDRDRAWQRVASAAELAGVWEEWLRHPEAAAGMGVRAAELVTRNQGALERTLEILEPILTVDVP